ncbi:MAG: hypothetical protein HY884_03335 [Deltaproteobacteria bacterium]|nr:hypothetical protein [Deltaproteobacteria bacterium]
MTKPKELAHSFCYREAFTYADMRKGHTDKKKREKIRKAAVKGFPKNLFSKTAKWAFKIVVEKSGKRPFDIENVPKLIIDAFCKKQIEKDSSEYEDFALYPDDTIDHVVFFAS